MRTRKLSEFPCANAYNELGGGTVCRWFIFGDDHAISVSLFLCVLTRKCDPDWCKHAYLSLDIKPVQDHQRQKG
jgi:hypothetical protein